MIDLFYWPTPNGWKISILLEELAVPYTVHPINISKGDQFAPEFLKIAPNNRMPAIIDQAPADGGASISLFESGAIMQYLARKHDQFYPVDDVRAQAEVDQWLFWQVGGLGPMAGQCHHFRHYAPEKIPYGIERYTNEVSRLYGVLDRRLADREFIAGAYSIADMAIWPWAKLWENQGQDLSKFPHMQRWLEQMAARPAVVKGLAVGEGWREQNPVTDEKARAILFGQKA
ncbi:glutathione S-transferase N-terminal domain-containing protein [Insolitispirillum peregrinum]|uniref:glutathione S-transferase N-terminal domain-containing protein n=1 Tax=Insolitispirillum peregrinum TaxID=80876 RepID=UPI00361DB2E9